MKKIKLAIIDKDGTLTETVSGATFVQSPTDQKLIDGVQQAIAKLVSEGYTLAIASNQGGVAAGHKSLEDAIAEMRYAMELTGITKACFCPNFNGDHMIYLHDEEEWGIDIEAVSAPSFRKPDAGMLLWLADGYSEAIMIGDRPEDEQSANNANIPFIHAKDWWIK